MYALPYSSCCWYDVSMGHPVGEVHMSVAMNAEGRVVVFFTPPTGKARVRVCVCETYYIHPMDSNGSTKYEVCRGHDGLAGGFQNLDTIIGRLVLCGASGRAPKFYELGRFGLTHTRPLVQLILVLATPPYLESGMDAFARPHPSAQQPPARVSSGPSPTPT